MPNQWSAATHNFVHTAEGFRSRRAMALTTRYNDLSLWITTAAISLNAAPALSELATKNTLFSSHVTASCQLKAPPFQQLNLIANRKLEAFADFRPTANTPVRLA